MPNFHDAKVLLFGMIMVNHYRYLIYTIFLLLSAITYLEFSYRTSKFVLENGSVLTTGKLRDGTFYREVISSAENKSDFGVLLLHGAAFSSKTWETIGTLQKLSEWGFSTISIDLPSYKHSKKVVIPKQKADYLHHIRNHFEILKNHNFILVTPSMSGGYAIPFLLQKSEYLAAFIAIAPATSNAYGPSTYAAITTKTLFVYGSKDKNLGKRGSEMFQWIPNSTIEEINDASHACYLDYPDIWHMHLEKFIFQL